MSNTSDDQNDPNFDPATLDLSDVDTSEKLPPSERTMQVLQNMFRDAAEQMGPELYRETMVRQLLPLEEQLRATCPPDHPALVILDEYRAEQARKERGFE